MSPSPPEVTAHQGASEAPVGCKLRTKAAKVTAPAKIMRSIFGASSFGVVLPVKVEPNLPVACDGGHRTCDWYRAMATPSISAIAAEGGAGAARRLSVPGPRKSLPG